MNDTWIIVMILSFVALGALTLLALVAVYMREYWKFMGVPHEEPKRLLHACRELTGAEEEDEQEQFQRIYQRFKGSGPFCGFYQRLQPRVLVLERELVKQILINDFSNFNDRCVYSNAKQDPLSADLYSRTGHGWQEMRLKLEPIFMVDQMRQLHASVCEDSHLLVQGFETALNGQDEVSIEVQQQMRRYVLRNIAKCVFGLNAELLQKYPPREFEEMTRLLLNSHRHGETISTAIRNHPSMGRRLGIADTNQKVANYFNALINDMVSQREQQRDGELHNDYLQQLIDIKTQELSTHESDDKEGEKDGGMSALRKHLTGELAAHAVLFLKSGLEPTAHTLSYVLYELAENQVEQERVREELQEALSRHDNELTYECVDELQYMWQVIAETVRMHPLKPYLMRRALHDYRVPNHTKYLIRKDMCVIIPTDAIHHDARYYPEPHAFQPERFAPQVCRTREQCIWLGFGEGPRGCIGVYFAQLQMRVALARLLLQYKFSLDMRKLVIRCQDGVALVLRPLSKPNTEQEAKIEI